MIALLKKLRDILPRGDRKKAVGLLVLMIIAGFLEVAGISLILAFISIVSEPDHLFQISWLSPILQNLGIEDARDLLIYGSFTLIGVFLLKNLYLVLFYSIQASFIYKRFASIAGRLFRRYMNASYVFHLQDNTSRLVRNVTVETTLIGHFVMLPIMVIVMESVIMASIVTFLLIVEPLNTLLVLIVIGGTGGLYLRLVKRRVNMYGADSQVQRAMMIQRVNEGLGGIKEIMVQNRQPWFLHAFDNSVQQFARAEKFKQIFRQSSKSVVETFAVSGMLLIALILVWQGRGISSIIPVLSLFGVATFKLMPSLDKVISNYNILRYYGYALKPIHDDLLHLQQISETSDPKTGNEVLHLNNSIVLENIKYTYPGNRKPVVKDLQLTIRRNTTVGLVGMSGSGKTTIIDLMLGLLDGYDGTIRVDGIDIKDRLTSWQRNIGYIPQFIYLADNTIRNNIAFGINDPDIDERAVQRAISMAQLKEFIESLPEGLNTVVGERGVRLSGGQRQRIGIARALYHDPDVLIMDEATSSLDTHTERGVMASIEQLRKDRTIVIVAHRISTVQDCDELFVINDGHVADQGTYEELCTTSKEFAAIVQTSKDS